MRHLTRDGILDALALVRCAHEHDGEGAGVLLDNGDVRQVAVFLAVVVRDLLGEIAEMAGENRAVLVAELVRRCREEHGISGP